MTILSEKKYKETKQIMLAKKVIKPEFISLAEWIDNKYKVKTINIFYDTIDYGKIPRIQICFEYEKEEAVFKKDMFRFNSVKQKAIAEKFKEIIKKQTEKEVPAIFHKSGKEKYRTKNVLVVFGNFESAAKQEANEGIPQEKIKELKKEIKNNELWEISNMFSSVTFFLYTNEQIKKYENSKAQIEWIDKYFELLKEYDEFGYFKREKFSIRLDSKENFDNHYEGKWWYYYK